MQMKRITYKDGRIEEFECRCGEGNVTWCENCVVRAVKPEDAPPLLTAKEKVAREKQQEDREKERQRRKEVRKRGKGTKALRKILERPTEEN